MSAAWRLAMHEYRREVRASRKLPPAIKLVAEAILDRFGDSETSWPSQRGIYRDAGLRSFGYIRIAIKRLVKDGILTATESGGRFTFGLPEAVLARLRDRAAEIEGKRSTQRSATDTPPRSTQRTKALRSENKSAPLSGDEPVLTQKENQTTSEPPRSEQPEPIADVVVAAQRDEEKAKTTAERLLSDLRVSNRVARNLIADGVDEHMIRAAGELVKKMSGIRNPPGMLVDMLRDPTPEMLGRAERLRNPPPPPTPPTPPTPEEIAERQRQAREEAEKRTAERKECERKIAEEKVRKAAEEQAERKLAEAREVWAAAISDEELVALNVRFNNEPDVKERDNRIMGMFPPGHHEDLKAKFEARRTRSASEIRANKCDVLELAHRYGPQTEMPAEATA